MISMIFSRIISGLRALGMLAAAWLMASSVCAVDIQYEIVGDIGNPPDPASSGFVPGIGSVGYPYRIGKYHVTCAQYAEFLNARAQSDPLNLYDGRMDADATFGGIVRSGNDGAYSYAVKPGFANKPVVFVTFSDAARFVNWLHNGQGSGDTETGAYTLLGGTTTPSNFDTVVRNPAAAIFLPTESEWYKAAYYQGDGTYRVFGTGSNTDPTATTPPGAVNSANYNGAVGALTDVGAYSATRSHYQTADQAGNAMHWTETRVGGSPRNLRGGAWNNSIVGLRAYDRLAGEPFFAYDSIGFRVAASVPPPQDPPPPRGLGRIMALGDSLTQSQSDLFSYRYWLWVKLLDQGVDFDLVGTLLDNGIGGFPPWPPHNGKSFDQNHEGHSGLRIDQIRDNVLNWTAGYVPDVVLLIAGTNDALGGRDTALSVADLREIITRLRTRNVRVTVCLATLPPVGADRFVPGGGGIPVNTVINALNAQMPAIAADMSTAASRVLVVDLNTGFNFATEGLADGIHPNTAGEQKIAARFFEALQIFALAASTGADESGHLTINFLRIKTPFQLSYTVEVSGDLQQWFSGPAETEIAATPVDHFNGTETVSVRDRKSTATDGQRFIRLRLAY